MQRVIGNGRSARCAYFLQQVINVDRPDLVRWQATQLWVYVVVVDASVNVSGFNSVVDIV